MKAIFLLPENYRNCSKAFIRCLADELLSSMPNSPWFATKEKRGEGIYINIFFSERPFYSEKTLIKNYAKSSIYKNPITGKLCKEDSPNAVIVHKKGDLTSSYESHFGKKYDKLWSKPFKKLMAEIRDIYDSVLSRFNCIPTDDVFINKVDFSALNKTSKINAIIKNKKLKFIENLLSEAYSNLKYGYFLDERDVDVSFIRLVFDIQKLLKNDYIKYKHIKIPLTIDQDRSTLINNLDYLVNLCIRKIDDFMRKYVYIF